MFGVNSKGAEPTFKNPRVKLLWDRWRNVWMLAWERQRRLQDRLNYLLELEKVKNFSWDQWRKRVCVTRVEDVIVERRDKSCLCLLFTVPQVHEPQEVTSD
jgi:hypothetical protein